MDPSHKAALSNYPSVFTVVLRAVVFGIRPVLLSTEQQIWEGAGGNGVGVLSFSIPLTVFSSSQEMV